MERLSRNQTSAPRKERLSALLEEVRRALSFDQPAVRASLDCDRWMVVAEGDYLLAAEVSPGSGPIAAFSIRIEFDPGFPRVEPMVFERGDKIRKEPDYHVNPDGSFCTGVFEGWLARTPEPSIDGWLQGPLRNYFLGQQKNTGRSEDPQYRPIWPFDELPHGSQGLLEDFAEILECPADENAVRRHLERLVKKRPKGHRPCPCGSGRRQRVCCGGRIERLRTGIEPWRLRMMLRRFEEFFPRPARRSRATLAGGKRLWRP